MKVKELIDELLKCDAEATVVLEDSEWPYIDIKKVETEEFGDRTLVRLIQF